MNFVLLMALREIRASWKRLLFFFICIAIGVGSIVALRSVIQNVRGALARETRTLIASDILLSSNTPIPNDVREMVAREVRAGRVSDSTDMKFASPVQRGTRCQCKWPGKPAPADLPRLRPML